MILVLRGILATPRIPPNFFSPRSTELLWLVQVPAQSDQVEKKFTLSESEHFSPTRYAK